MTSQMDFTRLRSKDIKAKEEPIVPFAETIEEEETEELEDEDEEFDDEDEIYLLDEWLSRA